MQDKPVALVTGANQGIGLKSQRILPRTLSRCWLVRAIPSAARRRPGGWARHPRPSARRYGSGFDHRRR